MAEFGIMYLCLSIVSFYLASAKVYETKTKTIVVNVGESAVFACNHGHRRLEYLRWSYRPHDEPKGEIDLYDFTNNDVRTNYEASCSADEPACLLKLLKADEKSSGTYSCTTANGDFKVVEPVYNLVVGSMKCQSNVTADRQMIGENDCENVHPDVLNRTCMFAYHGYLPESPTIGWTRKYEDGHETEDNFPKKYRQELNTYVFNDIIKISSDMNEVLFQCHAKELPQIKPCSIPTFKVLSVKSTGPKLLIAGNEKNITCSSLSSSSVKCSCTWSHKFGVAETTIGGCHLPEVHRKQPGTYICNVECKLPANKYCNIKSVETVIVETVIVETVIVKTEKKEDLSLDFSSKPLLIACLSLIAVVVILVSLLVLFGIKTLKRRQSQASTLNQHLLTDEQNRPLNPVRIEDPQAADTNQQNEIIMNQLIANLQPVVPAPNEDRRSEAGVRLDQNKRQTQAAPVKRDSLVGEPNQKKNLIQWQDPQAALIQRQVPQAADTPLIQKQFPQAAYTPLFQRQVPQAANTPLIQRQVPHVTDTPLIQGQVPQATDTFQPNENNLQQCMANLQHSVATLNEYRNPEENQVHSDNMEYAEPDETINYNQSHKSDADDAFQQNGFDEENSAFSLASEEINFNEDQYSSFNQEQESEVEQVQPNCIGGCKIYVRRFGHNTLSLDVKYTDTTGDVKELIMAREGISTDNQVLVLDGKILENQRQLSDYNIQKGDTIHLLREFELKSFD